MSRDINADDFLQAKVPFKLGVNKRCYKASTSSINMNWAIDASLHQKVVDGFRILVFSSVRSTKNDADTNRVLIDEVDSLFWIDDVSVIGAIDEFLLNFKVPCGLYMPLGYGI
jgi:hypothetical protein